MRIRGATTFWRTLLLAGFTAGGCHTSVEGLPLSPQAVEKDILATAEANPLGMTVNGKPAKYGDLYLERAVNGLPDIPMPWTVPKMVGIYERERDVWLQHFQQAIDLRGNRLAPNWKAESDRCGYLARVLAASQDPRAAVTLGATLDKSENTTIWDSAERGLFDYFVRDMDYGLPPEQRHHGILPGSFLVEESAAVGRWWVANKDALRKQAVEATSKSAK
jgi:hypothetical protein